MGTLNLRNYTVVQLTPDQVAALEEASMVHDQPTDDPCRICGRGCWGVVCRPCKNACPHDYTINGYVVRISGTPDARSRCLTCGETRPLPRGSRIANVCIRNNVERQDVPPCARCGATTGTELHHWAPRAIFNDADNWPQSPLCPTCHRTWHQAMRAAKGVSLPLDDRIGELPEWMRTAS